MDFGTVKAIVEPALAHDEAYLVSSPAVEQWLRKATHDAQERIIKDAFGVKISANTPYGMFTIPEKMLFKRPEDERIPLQGPGKVRHQTLDEFNKKYGIVRASERRKG